MVYFTTQITLNIKLILYVSNTDGDVIIVKDIGLFHIIIPWHETKRTQTKKRTHTPFYIHRLYIHGFKKKVEYIHTCNFFFVNPCTYGRCM